MQAFFSSVDTDELLANCVHYNYYISLIVNFDKNYKCKIAFPSKTKKVFENSIKGTDGKVFKIKTSQEEDNIIIGDLSIEFENPVNTPQWLVNRTSDLKIKKTEAAKKIVPSTNGTKWPGSTYPAPKSYNFYDDYTERSYSAYKFATGKQFLASLINISTEFKNEIISSSINMLLMAEDFDEQSYENALCTKIEDIHKELYGDDLLIDKHCEAALKELKIYKGNFGQSMYYDIIEGVLELYTELIEENDEV